VVLQLSVRPTLCRHRSALFWRLWLVRDLPAGPGPAAALSSQSLGGKADRLSIWRLKNEIRPRSATGWNLFAVQGRLSVSQQRLWILERLHPRNPTHNVSCGVRLIGLLDAENFGRAWREVVQPHEILRTEFHAVEGVPQRVFSGPVLRY